MLSWQQWLTINYKMLSYWSRHWHREEWRELLAHLSLYLEKNWPKFSKIPDGEERIKFCQTWMKNNVKWKNSDFNKTIGVNNFSDEWESSEELYEEPYDILAEDFTDDIKDFIVDLNRRFTESETKKILTVRQIYLTLQSHEKVLYDLYITQMLSLRDIAAKIDLPVSAVYKMVNELKYKIKNGIKHLD